VPGCVPGPDLHVFLAFDRGYPGLASERGLRNGELQVVEDFGSVATEERDAA